MNLPTIGTATAAHKARPNQDYAICSARGAVLTDGLGGHGEGARVARSVAHAALRRLDGAVDPGQVFSALAHLIHDDLNLVGPAYADLASGACLGAALVRSNELWITHAGDVRVTILIRRRNSETIRRTKDDVDEQGCVQSWVGPHCSRTMRNQCFRFEDHDDVRIALTTDGVHQVLPDQLITSILGQPRTPAEAARMLVDEARYRGSVDDATAVVIVRTPDTTAIEPRTLQ